MSRPERHTEERRCAALPTKVEVFHIANDPEELENVAERYPDRTRDMLKRLNEYAYDMLPSLQVEEWVAAKGADAGPVAGDTVDRDTALR